MPRCFCQLSIILMLSGPASALADGISATTPQALAVQDQALAVQEIAPGIYVHQGVHAEATPENLGGIANIGFIVGDQSVAVIDTGGSLAEGQKLLAAIRGVTNLPVSYVINTHFHPDHVLGNAAFIGLKPVFIAHGNLPRDLTARESDYLSSAKSSLGDAFKGTAIVLPQHLIRSVEQIDLGHRVLTLTPYPPAHTDADLTVLDEKTGTLFTGDLLFLQRIPAVDGSIIGWLKTIDRLQQVKAERAVPGHGPVSVPWPAALTDERRYLTCIVAATREQLKQGHSLQTAVETIDAATRATEGPKWQLFDDYNGRNITAAYTELEWE
jgi:quinoprotein relay system zinc metallohydrolase 2